MKPHLETAHTYWKKLLKKDDVVVDATCGNGKDAKILAELVPLGKVYALDIQAEAIARAKAFAPLPNIIFLQQSHAFLPEITDVQLVVYNLGYLPGGDRTITTRTETTLESIKNYLNIVASGGALSITCYPGHPEGAREEAAVSAYAATLPYPVKRHVWRPGSPILFHIEKLKF